MKYFVNLFVILIIIINPKLAISNDQIFYVNVNKIINQSVAGNFINQEIEKLRKINLSDLKTTKDNLIKEEQKILSQKNILSKDDYNKQLNILKDKVENYKKKQSIIIKELNDKRSNAKNDLMKHLNEILTDYAIKNDISFILNKKNVVVAKKDLDITDDIIILLNKKVDKITLK
tara:strand:- start:1056 stop:1580 length:525 start_codon:yes stop_codon:yes gene_type:complete